jgi:hypothetical protein
MWLASSKLAGIPTARCNEVLLMRRFGMAAKGEPCTTGDEPSHRSSRNDGSRNDEPGTGTTFLMPFLPYGIDFVPSFPPRTNDPGTRNAALFPFRGD